MNFAQNPAWIGTRPFSVESKTPESDIITSFVLRPVDGKPVPRHLPGQHLSFLFDVPGLPPQKRNYSISSAPNGETYRISVKREPNGTVSKWLHDHVAPGTVINVMPPSGSFILKPDHARPIVLLSGGVGLTPMVCMLEAIAAGHTKSPVQFIHSTISSSTHGFGKHVRKLVESLPDASATFFYSQPRDVDVSGRDYDQAGRLTMDWLKAHTPIEEADYFVCGPIPFMRTFVNGLAEAGVPTDRIHYEFFGPVEELIEEESKPAATESATLEAKTQFKPSAGLGVPDIGQALLESLSDGIVASDRKGTIVFWSPGATRIFGFSEQDALGQSLDIIIPEPFRDRHWEGYHETVASGESRYGAGDLLAVPGQHKDGRRISIEFTIVLMKDASGSVIGMASVVRDVTKKFEETKALKKQIAELTKA
ncbi:PAS domain S-box protein [Flaviflagellibacter deserti]|uniref:PAS domain S-box protein n=1 Tax=Flaviflagellibacter deserti TaxID=2267266 RepID=A0ABV9Z3K9_9HYPH